MRSQAAAEAETLPAGALHVHRPPLACCNRSAVWAALLHVQGHTVPTARPWAPEQDKERILSLCAASASPEYGYKAPGKMHQEVLSKVRGSVESSHIHIDGKHAKCCKVRYKL